MTTEDLKALFAAAREDNQMREVDREASVAQLDELTSDDPDSAHDRAEEIVMAYLRLIGESAVAEAFERARDRVWFWYSGRLVDGNERRQV